ncbi:MAG: VWA domain-containing protein [Acidobacteria bacterium]|nr:VWA domain-containing protein [Acidobacteriota bacterium]MBV9923625.1 VWA domain-containing protein [Acidobacteriota bacterium]
MPTATREAARPALSISLCLCLFLLALCALPARAQQEGASTAAAARTRYLSEMGLIPASNSVAVEEFVNYHRHQIGRPKAGEAVLMDVRWGNDRVNAADPEAVLQIGFSTALVSDRQQLPPVNLALVIDKSGSMADANKLTRVKEALLTLVNQLRETDTLSVVVFDSEAEVLRPARPLGDREEVRRLISQIEPGSSTNMHAGLMLGYQEALRHFNREGANRVVLLTDGIANQGVTDPERIARDSLSFNDRGVDLSTIGVGLDLNKDLLRQLAKSGRGLFHFVADAQDIDKVFLKEVQSLVAPVATEPNLTVTPGPGVEVAQVYGYDPQPLSGGLTFKLDNMNQGLTQVVLIRFRVRPQALDAAAPPTVRVKFGYTEVGTKRRVVKDEAATLSAGGGDLLRDPEVGKNFTIAQLAQAIHDMAQAVEAKRYKDAEGILNAAVAKTYQRYPHLEDEDISRTLLIAQKYQELVRKYNQEQQQSKK